MNQTNSISTVSQDETKDLFARLTDASFSSDGSGPQDISEVTGVSDALVASELERMRLEKRIAELEARLCEHENGSPPWVSSRRSTDCRYRGNRQSWYFKKGVALAGPWCDILAGKHGPWLQRFGKWWKRSENEAAKSQAWSIRDSDGNRQIDLEQMQLGHPNFLQVNRPLRWQNDISHLQQGVSLRTRLFQFRRIFLLGILTCIAVLIFAAIIYFSDKSVDMLITTLTPLILTSIFEGYKRRRAGWRIGSGHMGRRIRMRQMSSRTIGGRGHARLSGQAVQMHGGNLESEEWNRDVRLFSGFFRRRYSIPICFGFFLAVVVVIGLFSYFLS